MTDLAEFLLARIAEDETGARQAVGDGPASWTARPYWFTASLSADIPGVTTDELHLDHAQHIARWDPARVLAECEAKRRVVMFMSDEYHEPEVLGLLALPYADHPDYREEWRP